MLAVNLLYLVLMYITPDIKIPKLCEIEQPKLKAER